MEKINRIQIYDKNPYYWKYKDKPLLLLGASREDNLFQIPDLKEHLDLLASVGGNYIRNTMSDRDDGDAKAFARLSDGNFDLNEWNPEYWDRFQTMLRLTQERDIIVQIELWDQWDHQNGRFDAWQDNPWIPSCNVNYGTDNTTLQDKGAYKNMNHESGEQHDLFLTIPSLNNDTVVLPFQERFIEKMLSYSLKYGNVLYTITNELFIQHPTDWSDYWAQFVKAKAKEEDVEVHITEMFQMPDLEHVQHKGTLDHPELYSFFDMSQNANQKGDTHWEKIQWARQRVSAQTRPLNNVKMYGADTGWVGNTTKIVVERFWRNILGGAASARFHRPPVGIGLNEVAQASLKAAKLFTSKVNMWELLPDMSILKDRKPNEAYCASKPGFTYALYFTDGGSVSLDLSGYPGNYSVHWIDGNRGEWGNIQTIEGDVIVPMKAPGEGPWIAVILKN